MGIEIPDSKTAENLLDVSDKDYFALIDFLNDDFKVNDRVDASFHFIKYHDCVDREKDFLDVLKNHLVYYCFPKQRYLDKKPHEITKLVFEGRDKFFNPKDAKNGRAGSSMSGELGEIALYFLLESFLKAPQIVSKMSLKSTQGENYKGSDGIHLGIHNNKRCIFFCESKLNKELDKGLNECIKSVIDFHNTKRDFEVSIINNHIDVFDEELREFVIDYLDPSKPKNEDWLEINACFVGFNWEKFVEIEKEIANTSLLEKLKVELKQTIEPTKKHLTEKIVYPSCKQRFFFFLMPFKDIGALRTNFLSKLYGKDK